MGELLNVAQGFTAQIVDKAVYQIFSHFMITSAAMLLIFVFIGIVSGSLFASLAIGSFIWAILAVGCAKYCEMISNQRGYTQS